MNKADHVYRAVAKVIDLIIMGTLCNIPPTLVGVAAAATYILMSDGFFQGQSVGKRVVGLRVVLHDGRPCTFRESMIRNSLFAVIVILGSLPLIGIVFSIVGALIVGFEAYVAYVDEKGIRVSDIFAGTHVVQGVASRA